MQKDRIAMIMAMSQRFWQKVDIRQQGECWLYKESCRKGYGQFRVRGLNSKVGAHQVAFVLANGYLPAEVRHSCDNPQCCNPHHLEAGTRLQNMQDMVQRDRSLKGQKNHRAKLTRAQVDAIRAAPKEITNIHLATLFRCHHSNISSIRRHKTWG